MNPTQKKIIEIPFLFLLLWLIQALELTWFQLPFEMGSLQFIPIFLCYFALTRTWARLAVLTLVFSFVGTFTIGYPAIVYVAAQLWTVFFAKLAVKQFALEGRRPFLALVVGAHIFSKIVIWSLLKGSTHHLPLVKFVMSLPFTSLATAVVAWFLFPAFMWWDDFFQHPVAESRDLNPDIIG